MTAMNVVVAGLLASRLWVNASLIGFRLSFFRKKKKKKERGGEESLQWRGGQTDEKFSFEIQSGV